MSASKIPYRPYIDGLRGIAVVAVVLYHAKLLSVTGGFVGVDIFFVISGFLITSIIVRDLKTGTFSLLEFWERRVRRIIPALFVVILSTIIAAYFLMLYPEDSHYFGNTVIAQSVFTSNILFMLSDNYFDEHSRFSPLLHTWSLSVEEQFYVFFPFVVLLSVWLSRRTFISRQWLLFGGAKRPMLSNPTESDARNLWKVQSTILLFVAIIGALSLFLNIWFVDVSPSLGFKIPFFPGEFFWGTTLATAGFYLILSRAWELALGIILALYVVRIQSRIFAEIISAVGVIAIGAAVFLFNDETSFPGVAALVPTLGVVAIIVANESHPTKIGTLLSYSRLVFIGLISYSLYLWHWPLLVFANLASPVPLSKISMALLILVAVVISWLSYRLIEIPFRKKIFISKRNTLFIFGLAAMGTLAFLGFLIERSSLELLDRVPLSAKNILLVSSENVPWGGVCFQERGDESRYGGVCRIGDAHKEVKRQFVVWGDSHADALVPLFNIMGRTYDAQGVVFDGGNCVPVVGVHQVPAAVGCEEEKAFALRYIRDNDIKHIILVARWSYYVMGGARANTAAFMTDSNNASISPSDAQAVFKRNLTPMVEQLSHEGREVYIVEQVPEQFDFNIRDAFYRAVHTGQEIQFQGISTKEHEVYQELPNSVIDGLGALHGVHVINPATLLCKKGGFCDLKSGGKLIYRDESHLSTSGAMSLEPLFTPIFEGMHPLGAK